MLNFTQNTYYVREEDLDKIIDLLNDSDYYCINKVTEVPKLYKRCHSYDKLEDVLRKEKEAGNKSTLFLDNRRNLAAKYISSTQTTDIYMNQLYCLPPVKSLLQELVKEKPLMKVE